METEIDFYTTVANSSEEILFKEKNSKFFGQVFPISSEEDVKEILKTLRKRHSRANHICYAWQLGVEKVKYRANDDGEPNNSAGIPIYGQIKSSGLTNILITVTRFFGGTKLGVGGLISAYKSAAKMALEACQVIRKRIEVDFELQFPYSEMPKVMQLIARLKLKIKGQKMHMDCTMVISIPKSKVENFLEILDGLYSVSTKKVNG